MNKYLIILNFVLQDNGIGEVLVRKYFKSYVGKMFSSILTLVEVNILKLKLNKERLDKLN
jgi:hypothetical protein